MCKLLIHRALYFTLITVASPAAQGLRPGTPLWGYPSHCASLVGPSRSRSHGRLRRPKSLCHPSSRQVHHSAARLLAIVCKQRGRTRALESSSREATQAAAMTAGRRRCVLRASPCPCHSGKGVAVLHVHCKCRASVGVHSVDRYGQGPASPRIPPNPGATLPKNGF